MERIFFKVSVSGQDPGICDVSIEGCRNFIPSGILFNLWISGFLILKSIMNRNGSPEAP